MESGEEKKGREGNKPQTKCLATALLQPHLLALSVGVVYAVCILTVANGRSHPVADTPE